MSQLLKHIEAEKLSEMAMVDIAYEILRETNRTYNFRELMEEISALRGLTNEQLMSIIAQVYTEVNIDGRFVCISDNTWGLKRWYPTETIEETQEGGGGKKKKVVLDDDFDDYDLEEEVVEEYEDDDLVAFEEDEEEEEDFLDDEFVDEAEDEDELIEEEEVFEGEEIEEEDTEELDEDDLDDR